MVMCKTYFCFGLYTNRLYIPLYIFVQLVNEAFRPCFDP